MKVLVADKFEKSGVEGLKALGCEIVHEPDLKDDTLKDALAATGADVLVVRSTVVTEPMLDAGRLSLIVRAGAGYNTIDVKAASKRGIYVSNCPGKNSIAVAELAFGLLIALDRRIPDNVAELLRGKWNKKEYSKAKGLLRDDARAPRLREDRPGGGEAGDGLRHEPGDLERDGRGGGPRRHPGRPPAAAAVPSGLGGARSRSGSRVAKTPAEVAEKCDVLSIHLAAGPLTKNIVNADVIGRLKPGAYVINTARADIVDYGALAKAVTEKGIRVGVDVYPGEPASATAEFAHPILGLPGVYGTHHIGASTDQAQEAIAAETVRIVKTFKETGRVPNVVNLAKKTPATHTLIIRHRDQPGVAAAVFAKLSGAGINVHETENVVFENGEAAIARINVDKAPPAEVLASMKASCPDVLKTSVVALG